MPQWSAVLIRGFRASEPGGVVRTRTPVYSCVSLGGGALGGMLFLAWSISGVLRVS